MNMSYDSSNLTTPDIKWLGVRPSDLDRFNIPEQCRLPMTEEDMKTGKRLVGVTTICAKSYACWGCSCGAHASKCMGSLHMVNAGQQGDAYCLYMRMDQHTT